MDERQDIGRCDLCGSEEGGRSLLTISGVPAWCCRSCTERPRAHDGARAPGEGPRARGDAAGPPSPLDVLAAYDCWEPAIEAGECGKCAAEAVEKEARDAE